MNFGRQEHEIASALRESEERFRLLVQSVRDYAIFMLDPEGNVSSWNEGAQRINGYTADEIIGKHFSAFYPPADIEVGKTEMELDVARRTGKYEEEGWRVRKDKSIYWAHVLITAVRDESGELVGFAKVTRDLTERKKAELRALEDAKRLAAVEAASRMKSEFLAAMSHELRTPINATLGYVDLMEAGIGGEISGQYAEYLERIRNSQKHLLSIITDLLDYSRIEAGRIDYELEVVDVDSIISSVIPMLDTQSSLKNVTIHVDECPDELEVSTDRVRAEQIFLNLLSNAVKFTPDGSQVSVACTSDGERAAITVADKGPGVPEEDQLSVFEPFVQIGRSLTSGHKGTGMGLTISRDLARAMGGDITVTNGPDGGARFTCYLPLADPTD